MREVGIIACVFLSCACAKILEGQDPASCEDGEDNDLDGRIDCADDGGAAATVCVNAAREAAAAAKEKKPIPEEGPTFEIGGLTVARFQNGEDLSWAEGEAYCNNLKLQGFVDWRLPDVNEAVKIVESGRLKGEASYVMWTSTRKGAKRAVIVGMSGAVNDLGIQYRGQCRARCVRGAVAK